jgi:DNA replication ATP-dependent helicase Dna2
MYSTFSPPENLANIDPLFAAPTGPVWEFAAGEILEADQAAAQAYLVRQLPNVQSMLTVGPLLEQVTRFDHPRLFGPSFWTRTDDGVWVATAKPRGERIETSSLERMSWAEALEIWRPLAEAVTRLHRRGMVHGTLAPWTLWIDQPSSKATAIDAGCWIGDELSDLADADALWLAAEMRRLPGDRDPTPATDVYGLARLLIHLTLGAEQAATTRPSFTGIPAYAIPALDAALDTEPSGRPARVAEVVAAMAPRSFHQLPTDLDDGHQTENTVAENTVPDTMSVLHARVSNIERIEHPKFGRGVKFFLNLADKPPPNDQIGAFFYEEQAPEVFESVKWVWEGCELNLLEARVIENSGGQRFLTSNRATLPVLEPHMPMSVSNVLKAEGCPSRFLVDQRDRGGSSRPLVFGNLVHGLLDDLVEPDPPDFEEAFGKRARSLRLDMLAAGLTDRDMGSIYEDARQHFDNIRRFTSPRTHDAPDHDRVGWTGRNVEVTRYSTRYGIEGRVDLVAQDGREGLQIVELKSGSTWDGHLSQLRFYKLLWDGLAKSQGLEVNGHILYSRHGRMQSAPMEDTERERRILCARNELIACLRSFVDPDYDYKAPFFMKFPKACRSGSCKFRRDRCQAQTEVLGLAEGTSPWDAVATERWNKVEPELVARAWAWHEHFERLVEMERWASTAEMGKVLHHGRLHERKENHHAADGLELSQVKTKTGFIDFVGEHGRIFSPGDYLVAHRGDFHTSHILRGRVASVDGARVRLSTRGAAIASELPNSDWILDKLPARLGFRQAHHALYRALQEGSPDRLELLFRPDEARARELANAQGTPGGGARRADEPAEKHPEEHALNASQHQAVHFALTAPQGALIQGPPGTGKTTVIAHAVKELVARGERVLVSAFTNTAVDTILTKLLEVGCDDFLRIGPASRSPDLRRTLEEMGRDPAQFFTTDLAAGTDSLDQLSEEILGRQIIASTAHRCVSSSIMEFLETKLGRTPFDIAIVDEAGQITEPMTLTAVNLGERFALVGDHRQLPPIVENEQTHTNFIGDQGLEELDKMGCSGLDRSLFERLIEKLPHVMLDEQYRMHADIMAFSSGCFYDDKLRAHESVGAHTLEVASAKLEALAGSVADVLAPGHPLVFADVEYDEASGRHNQGEAEALVDTVEALFETSEDPGSIGVVSPFRAQVYLIRRLLSERLEERADRVDVDTVEKFQGSERDIILVSLVKTERAGDFLADERRLNVTLTRARKKLVVFGNRRCLELNPLYRRLIEQPETHVVSWSK